MSPIFDYLLMLPPAELRKIAKDLRARADEAEREAERKEQQEKQKHAVAKTRAKISTLQMLLARNIVEQPDEEQALIATARATGKTIDQLRPLIRKARMIAQGSEKQKRDREILQAARRGVTNSEIAARFNLHEKSVQRIIATYWKEQTP